ncbi:MAG: TPM domain-containing protein [Leptospiraceae bacterium]|nr:TPM domain-containing protein [Leptospiraceae bacterium]MCP5497042.1 TPM domain-containing protein [Leptospiraceae bacterium]
MNKLILIFITFLFAFVSGINSEVVDSGGMFSSQAISKANEKLTEIKRQTNKEMVIETIDSLDNKNVSDVALEKARARRVNGVFVLIAKKEKKISIKVGGKTQQLFGRSETGTLKAKFTEEFKTKNFDNGLLSATDYFAQVITTAPKNHRSQSSAPPVASASRGGSSFPWFKILVIGIIGFLIFRLIGFLISRSMGGGSGAPGHYGQGGGYGYGGGGGPGIMGSIMGGLFGAMAGSWLYDKFTGNDGLFANSSQDNYGNSDSNDSWSSQDDGYNYSDDSGSFDGGGSSDWGGDSGGGDWGGGDSGGGDW